MKSDASLIVMSLAVILSYIFFTVGVPLLIQAYLRSRHLHDRPPGIGAVLGAKYGSVSAIACLAVFLLLAYLSVLRGGASHWWNYRLWVYGALTLVGLLAGACSGYLTGLAIGVALHRIRVASSSRAMIIGLAVSSAIALSVNLLLIPQLGVSPFGNQAPEIYWLVLGMPSAMQILLGGWGGAQIQKLQSGAHPEMRPNTA